MHLARFAKAHFNFGRVHVHIHPLGRDGNEQDVGRLTPAVQHVFVGRTHAVGDEFVAHIAAVHVHILLVGTAARELGCACATGDLQHAEVEHNVAALRHEVGPQHIVEALSQRGFAPLLHQLAFVPNGKAHVRPRQRVAAHGFHAMRQFGGLGFQKLAPRRRAEKQLTHLDAGAHAARRWAQFTGTRIQSLSMGCVRRAAGNTDLGNRRNRSECLASKPHGGHGFQVAQRIDFAGRVAAQGQRQLGAGNAEAVVFDDDAAYATRRQFHRHFRRTGVQCVVHQLTHHRGWPLHHFTGGDLADEFVGQFADGPSWCRFQSKIHRLIVEMPVSPCEPTSGST